MSGLNVLVQRRSVPSLHSAKPLILRFSQQPWIFDLRRWASAAQYADDFSGGVALAVDVGFVRLRCGVADKPLGYVDY